MWYLDSTCGRMLCPRRVNPYTPGAGPGGSLGAFGGSARGGSFLGGSALGTLGTGSGSFMGSAGGIFGLGSLGSVVI